ncbi:hypothetical protein GCM10027259_50550 [Micromonospora palomenae]
MGWEGRDNSSDRYAPSGPHRAPGGFRRPERTLSGGAVGQSPGAGRWRGSRSRRVAADEGGRVASVAG